MVYASAVFRNGESYARFGYAESLFRKYHDRVLRNDKRKSARSGQGLFCKTNNLPTIRTVRNRNKMINVCNFVVLLIQENVVCAGRISFVANKNFKKSKNVMFKKTRVGTAHQLKFHPKFRTMNFISRTPQWNSPEFLKLDFESSLSRHYSRRSFA